MGKIAFEKVVREARLLSPLLDFKPLSQHIEVRKDPLTGKQCRINVERAKRPKEAACVVDVRKIVRGAKSKCFFCPKNLEKKTPMLPSDFPERRIRVGSACLFPNLFPFGEFHAVAVFSNDHYLTLAQFSPKLLEDCFTACMRYLEQIRAKHPDVNYCNINWNHMPPAAASILHPHVQILADRWPTTQVRELIKSSKRYHDRNGSNYWLDLVDAERGGERFIGQTGSVAWLASFAPGGNNEVLAVFLKNSALTQLNKRGLSDFCNGLSWVLKGYCGMGVTALNMGMFSGPSDEDTSDYYLLTAKLVSRPAFHSAYTGDDGFMEKLHCETVVETMPEEIAGRLRGQWEGG